MCCRHHCNIQSELIGVASLLSIRADPLQSYNHLRLPNCFRDFLLNERSRDDRLYLDRDQVLLLLPKFQRNDPHILDLGHHQVRYH